MRKFVPVLAALILSGCVNIRGAGSTLEEQLLETAREAARKFDYYDEISPDIPDVWKGESEIGGQCGDYAVEFVNLWNARHPEKALLVIQQQGLEPFPDGFYEVVGKDPQDLPFLKERTTSMLYIWNNVYGIGHPELGGYVIRLVKEVHVTRHLGLENWEQNGPHVWAVVGGYSVDPTFADFGTLPVIGKDIYQK